MLARKRARCLVVIPKHVNLGPDFPSNLDSCKHKDREDGDDAYDKNDEEGFLSGATGYVGSACSVLPGGHNWWLTFSWVS